MASKAVIIAGLVLLVAAVCYAESEVSSEGAERRIQKRGIIGFLIAGLGDGLKYAIDGLNKGVKGFLTGLTYLTMGFTAGVSDGLQKWRLGFYELFNAVVNLAQNILDTILLSPLHTNFLGENHV